MAKHLPRFSRRQAGLAHQAGRLGTPLPDGPRMVRGWPASVWGRCLAVSVEEAATSEVRTPQMQATGIESMAGHETKAIP